MTLLFRLRLRMCANAARWDGSAPPHHVVTLLTSDRDVIEDDSIL